MTVSISFNSSYALGLLPLDDVPQAFAGLWPCDFCRPQTWEIISKVWSLQDVCRRLS